MARPAVAVQPESRFLELLAATRHVVAPTTLLTALLFYFGWIYTNARALYFGIDPSALGFSNQDYLLRSIEPVFLPLAVLALVAIAVSWLHRRLTVWSSQPDRPARGVALAMGGAGVALLLIGVSGWLNHPVFGTDFIITPLGLGVGPAAIMYAVRFHQRAAPRAAAEAETPGPPPNALTGPLVLLLAVLSLFAAVDDWADAVGRGRARQLAQNLASRPRVVVYSREQLHLAGPGVVQERLNPTDSAYLYRYGGLRLLVRSQGQYFLLPERWTPATGQAVILPDTKEFRYEFRPG